MKRIKSTAHLRLVSSSLRLGLAFGVGGVFASVGSAAGTSKDTYYVNDHLASTVATADAAGEIAQIESDAFGTQAGAEAKDSRFTGKPYDADMGAYVFPFRNYRSDEARWMSADPSGFPDGANTASYVVNPLNMVDPTGLATLMLNVNSTFGNSSVYYIPHNQQTVTISGSATVTFTIKTVPDSSQSFTSTGTITTSATAPGTSGRYDGSGSGTVNADATAGATVSTINLTLDPYTYTEGSYTFSITASASHLGNPIGSTTNSFSFRVVQE